VHHYKLFRSQSAAAAASSTALAEALLARTKRGDGGDSGSGRHASADDGKRLHPSSWTETRDSVNTSIGLADSYTEMILVRLRLPPAPHLSLVRWTACLLALSTYSQHYAAPASVSPAFQTFTARVVHAFAILNL
jgi:hypothetical protein